MKAKIFETVDIPIISGGNRLDVETMLSISYQFQKHIFVPEWNRYGSNKEKFQPFEILSSKSTKSWFTDNNVFDCPPDPPEGFIFPAVVRWMPKFYVSTENNEKIANMIYSCNYITHWHPELVATNIEHALMVFNRYSNSWLKFNIPTEPFEQPEEKCEAFVSFLHAWINWQFQ